MAVQPILIYPHPLLKEVALECDLEKPVTRSTASDLVDTMRAHNRCVGIAAPQIGVGQRLVVVDVTAHPKTTSANGLLVLVNPLISAMSGAQIGREGCLSLPAITVNVERPTSILVEALSVEGTRISFESEGFEARALLHEIDHLDGILILDRARSPSEIFARQKEGGPR